MSGDVTPVSLSEALRIAADIADNLGELAYGLGVEGLSKKISIGFFTSQGEPAVKIREATRILGGRWAKNDPNESQYEAAYYRLTNTTAIAGWSIELWTQREQVCDRRQVGTRVERTEAVAASEREVPVWEYDCTPLNVKADAALDQLARELEGVSA